MSAPWTNLRRNSKTAPCISGGIRREFYLQRGAIVVLLPKRGLPVGDDRQALSGGGGSGIEDQEETLTVGGDVELAKSAALKICGE